MTPFFLKVPKNSTEPFSFRYYGLNNEVIAENFQYKDEKCDVVWTDPLIEKIPLFKALFPEFLKELCLQ